MAKVTPYCDLADVEGRVRGPALTTTSVPTRAEVTALCVDKSAAINAALSVHKVTTPVTAPDEWVAWLRDLAACGVLSIVARMRKDTDLANHCAEEWRDGLAEIRAGKLPDGMAVASAGLPTSYALEYADTDSDVGDIQEPVFNTATGGAGVKF